MAEGASAERRHVSVLFADLVGYTALSEHRDAEDVRELLTRYFDSCRNLVARYGGTVEKFIGDAVMAVWGTPVAQEDDAERAVRAALDLVELVPTLGRGDDELRARAAVLSGEAAVTLDALQQGMVAGDLVNTASRAQALAEPGTVLVGDATRQATDTTIVYADAGRHELKGKAEPVHLWRAVRVVAGRRGALRAEGLETPFVGRERELRLVKELFHAGAEERRAHLLSVVGIAGIGKSRLAWEFEKYIDGLVSGVLWHRGRCLAYGEGVTYWALAEMIRMRAGIAEGEPPDTAAAKLHSTVEEHVPDEGDQRWIEPRLAQLLGLEERSSRESEDLYSAWRLFFERMAEQDAVVLVFEDLQWADASLLQFIEYLLEWSRTHPIYVLTLARPELAERHAGWGAGKRNFTSLFLEPLPDAAMTALLEGLVPGLAEDLRTRISERAEGVPLYAVETVRMLLDRGLLVREGSTYRVTGEVQNLAVPETLHALVAARLDSLPPGERRLLQDAAVLGKTFSTAALASLGDTTEAEVTARLTSLVRKEVLSLQRDPRSPERGQYGFLQELVRHVAYETVSKRERKARHLAAAAWLASSWVGDPDEIAAVLAAHHLEAYRLDPDGADAHRLRELASQFLAAGAERAASLAASSDAQRFFEQAAEEADDPLARARLHERAGEMAWIGSRGEEAAAHLHTALRLFEENGAAHPAARVAARLGKVDWDGGHEEAALERMERALAALQGQPLDADLAELTAELAWFSLLQGDAARAGTHVEAALAAAERLGLPQVIVDGFVTKAWLLEAEARFEEEIALLKHGLDLAREKELSQQALRAMGNLREALEILDRYEEALEYEEQGLTLARRVGNRRWELANLNDMAHTLVCLGEWQGAIDRATEAYTAGAFGGILGAVIALVEVRVCRGEIVEAEATLAPHSSWEGSPDLQARGTYGCLDATILGAKGWHGEALAVAERTFRSVQRLGMNSYMSRKSLVAILDASSRLGDLPRLEGYLELVENAPPASVAPFLHGQAERFRARLHAARDEDQDVQPSFKRAMATFSEIKAPFWLAVAQLECAEWLAGASRIDEAQPLLAEARDTFARLKARPWVERVDAARQPAAVPA